MKYNKIGQGHVEMIMSFILFIAIVLFFFIIVNPFSVDFDSSNQVFIAKKVIIENVTSNVGKLSVVLDAGPPVGTCYNFSIEDYTVKGVDPSDLHFQEYHDTLEPRRYFIMFSDSFDSDVAPTYDYTCDDANYELGIYVTNKLIIAKRLKQLRKYYRNDYEKLKRELGITNDFAFIVKELNTKNEIIELSATKDLPVDTERSAVEIPLRMMDETGEIKEIVINIVLW